jgi:hypothetical protein
MGSIVFISIDLAKLPSLREEANTPMTGKREAYQQVDPLTSLTYILPQDRHNNTKTQKSFFVCFCKRVTNIIQP